MTKHDRPFAITADSADVVLEQQDGEWVFLPRTALGLETLSGFITACGG